jgi:hypothetical protein
VKGENTMDLAKAQCTYIILDTCLNYSRLLCDNTKQQELLSDATKAFLDTADLEGYTDSTKLLDDYNAYLREQISSEFDSVPWIKAAVAAHVTYTDAQLDSLKQIVTNVNTTAKGIDFAADKYSARNMMAEYIKQNHETLCSAFKAKCGVKPDKIWYDEAENAIKASKVADNVVETLMVDIVINSKGQTDV